MKTFISYAHADESLKQRFEQHISGLESSGRIQSWSDRKLFAGDVWSVEIENHLKEAELIIALISPAFLSSVACREEVSIAVQRAETGAAVLVPLVLRDCDWTDLPYGKFQAANWNGTPIVAAADQDTAFKEAVKEIRRLVTARSSNAGDITPAKKTPARPAIAIKREFSEFERDSYLDEAFERIKTLMNLWLDDLAAAQPELKVRKRSDGSSRFLCSVYPTGKRVSAGTIFISSAFGGRSIGWIAQETTESNSFNEQFVVEAAGGQLGLRSMGMLMVGQRDANKLIDPDAAAAQLYEALIRPLSH